MLSSHLADHIFIIKISSGIVANLEMQDISCRQYFSFSIKPLQPSALPPHFPVESTLHCQEKTLSFYIHHYRISYKNIKVDPHVSNISNLVLYLISLSTFYQLRWEHLKEVDDKTQFGWEHKCSTNIHPCNSRLLVGSWLFSTKTIIQKLYYLITYWPISSCFLLVNYYIFI